MNMLFAPGAGPRMIAHRGYSGLEMENTASAFVAAGNRSFWGIETDVHVTRDGQFIIIHDDTTGRVAAEDLPVEGSPFEALRSLRLKDRDGRPGRGDLILPTLEEYLGICKKYDKYSVLELKNPMRPEHIDRILDCVREAGWLERTVFISFSLENMIHVRRRLPQQKAQFLIEEPRDDLMDVLRRYRLDLDIDSALLTRELAQALRAAGIEINVWTVNDPKEALRLADWGVNYLTSNILE